MWDDIIIGESKSKSQICSAIKKFDISVDNISENGESYWISNCILDTGMKIYKDTPEGKKVEELIQNKAVKAKIQNYLDKLILENISLTSLKAKIKNGLKESFEKGKQDKLHEIQTVLGIKTNVLW